MASSVQTCTEIPPQRKPLPPCPGCTILAKLTVPRQKYALWCWAAVAVAIDHFFREGSPLTQCQVASRQKNAGDCCLNPCSDNCSGRLDLEKVLCTVNCLAQGPVPVPPTFSFSNLKALMESVSPNPVCARIQYKGRGGHFVVIKGFQDASESLIIADPEGDETLAPFKEFKGTPISYSFWTHYYLTDKVNHGNCS
jgi:hypothetical protein